MHFPVILHTNTPRAVALLMIGLARARACGHPARVGRELCIILTESKFRRYSFVQQMPAPQD